MSRDPPRFEAGSSPPAASAAAGRPPAADPAAAEDEYSIRAVAAATRVSAHTLRYYEDTGLMIDVPRRSNGHRCYSEQHIRWVRFLKRLRSAGMSISQVREYAALVRHGDASLPARAELLEQHQREVDARLRELAAHREVIAAKIRRYRELGLGCEPSD